MDAYDHMVAYLTAHPDEICDAWCADMQEHPAHKLFAFASKSRKSELLSPGRKCGCLTQIRLDRDYFRACNDELTEAIAADDRIPTQPDFIETEDLPAFAEWQRRIDAELGRTPPAWTPPEPAQ